MYKSDIAAPFTYAYYTMVMSVLLNACVITEVFQDFYTNRYTKKDI